MGALPYLAGAVLGLVLGFPLGLRWGAWDLAQIIEMPSGGYFLSHRTNSIWQKSATNAGVVTFLRVPDPWQAQVTRMFAPLTQAPVPTPVVPEEKKP